MTKTRAKNKPTRFRKKTITLDLTHQDEVVGLLLKGPWLRPMMVVVFSTGAEATERIFNGAALAAAAASWSKRCMGAPCTGFGEPGRPPLLAPIVAPPLRIITMRFHHWYNQYARVFVKRITNPVGCRFFFF